MIPDDESLANQFRPAEKRMKVLTWLSPKAVATHTTGSVVVDTGKLVLGSLKFCKWAAGPGKRNPVLWSLAFVSTTGYFLIPSNRH